MEYPKAGEDPKKLNFTATFLSNIISGVDFVQPFVVEHQYRGAVITLDTKVYNSTLVMRNNTLQDLHIKAFITIESGLIYVDGASIKVEKNFFYLLGVVTNEKLDC